MSTPKSNNNGGIKTWFFVAAAALLSMLIVVLFLLSGALKTDSHVNEEEISPTVATETEKVTEAPTPVPTATPEFHIYVSSSSGGDAYATTNTVKQGGSDHVTIIPDFGWTVASVTINGAATTYTSSFDLTEISADTVIHVEFVALEQPTEELEPLPPQQEEQEAE